MPNFPFIDEMTANKAEKFTQFVDNLEAIWAKRPMTLVHGDCNPGNVWRQKDKKQDEFVIGDWQLLLKCPIGLDFATLYLCTKGLDTQVCSGANCLPVVLT